MGQPESSQTLRPLESPAPGLTLPSAPEDSAPLDEGSKQWEVREGEGCDYLCFIGKELWE